MNTCELSVGISALANTIACQLSDEELSFIAAVFTQMGDTLAAIAAHRALCEGKRETEDTPALPI